MTDLDLTEAVDAAARAAWRQDATHASWDELSPTGKHSTRESVLPLVAAAAPLIAAQARNVPGVGGARDDGDDEEPRTPLLAGTQDDMLCDLHARYHCQTGNLLGRDECGWEQCELWDAAKHTLAALDLPALLDGATKPGPENAYPSTPGEFAARWNSWDDERRSRFLAAAVEDAGLADRLPALLAAERERGREEQRRETAEHVDRYHVFYEDGSCTDDCPLCDPYSDPAPGEEADRCLPDCAMNGEVYPDGSGTTWIDHAPGCPRATAPGEGADRG